MGKPLLQLFEDVLISCSVELKDSVEVEICLGSVEILQDKLKDVWAHVWDDHKAFLTFLHLRAEHGRKHFTAC